jgi:hypothetical protein
MPFSQRGVKDYFQEVGFYYKIQCLAAMAKFAPKGWLGQICRAIAIPAQ